MSQPINFIPNGAITTGRVVPQIGKTKIDKTSGHDGTRPTFNDVLNIEVAKQKELEFSAHALKRMQDRNISLSEQELGDIKQAVEKASGKGIRESLVVMKDVALIVNIANKTVITAVDSKSIKENVFTNIDGAVFI
ncbi:MAG: flagellar biosynthesis protein [Hyphomonadaceae bacterium]|nr:flagellar biosynthesis protein [Clostridia bacterium]